MKECKRCNIKFHHIENGTKYCGICRRYLNHFFPNRKYKMDYLNTPFKPIECNCCESIFMTQHPQKTNCDACKKKYTKSQLQCRTAHYKKWRSNYEKNPKSGYNKPITKISRMIRKNLISCLTCKGVSKNGSTFDLLDFTKDEFREHMESLFETEMWWHNHGEWHIDHIIPSSAFKFDSVDHPEFKVCWSLGNLRPMWAKDNIRKGNKWVGNI